MTSQAQFQILKIAAYSDYPVRNSVGHLVFGSHVLWEKGATNEKNGPLGPQVFSHDFDLPVSQKSSIHVTVEPLDIDDGKSNVGGDYRLHGKFDNVAVFQSDFVTIDSKEPVTITATVIEPEHSPRPFCWSGEFTWELQHRSTGGDKISHVSPKTYLELYWLSKDVHDIFLAGRSGIPVDLLRNGIPGLTADSLKKIGVRDVPRAKMRDATYRAYSNFSKTYDTTAGRPHFGVNGSGGTFQYNYYIQARPGGAAGSLQPVVNCYDQGAMVQVLGTIIETGLRPSWLYMGPFGYINQANLVGIGACNNPFFASNRSPAVIGINDTRRTGFGNHVFNGALTNFNANSDSIYDGCTLLGYATELRPQAYINTAIDSVTILTRVARGTIANISQKPGVTNMTRMFHQPIEHSTTIEHLIKNSSAHAPKSKPISQAHWNDVGEWITSVVGGKIEVAFHEVRFSDEAVEELWHSIGADYGDEDQDDNLVLRVRTHTQVGSDGKLDLAAASAVTVDDFRSTLKNTDLDLGKDDEGIENLWEAAPLTDYGQVAIQYKPALAQGRFLIISGNCLIDASGASSSAALLPVVQKVLAHTTIDKPLPLDIPNVTRHTFHLPPAKGGRDNVVKGIGTSFALSCTVSALVVAATAKVKDLGLLLDHDNIENDHSHETSVVKFKFITRKLGLHDVDLEFASAPAMTLTTKKIQVEVIEG